MEKTAQQSGHPSSRLATVLCRFLHWRVHLNLTVSHNLYINMDGSIWAVCLSVWPPSGRTIATAAPGAGTKKSRRTSDFRRHTSICRRFTSSRRMSQPTSSPGTASREQTAALALVFYSQSGLLLAGRLAFWLLIVIRNSLRLLVIVSLHLSQLLMIRY
jgi:hypothetical protein